MYFLLYERTILTKSLIMYWSCAETYLKKSLITGCAALQGNWAFESHEKEYKIFIISLLHVVIKAFHVLCLLELLIFIFLKPHELSRSFKGSRVAIWITKSSAALTYYSKLVKCRGGG